MFNRPGKACRREEPDGVGIRDPDVGVDTAVDEGSDTGTIVDGDAGVGAGTDIDQGAGFSLRSVVVRRRKNLFGANLLKGS